MTKAEFGAFGSDRYPGLAKMVEENSEAGTVIGKIYGIGHMGNHWDNAGILKERLENELADQIAAISFFSQKNGLDMDRMDERTKEKYLTFCRWDKNVSEGRDPNDDGDR